MAYPGGKGNVYQQIINQIPPHSVYIESHLGGGAVMAKKRPANLNIGIDLNYDVLCETAASIAPDAPIISETSAAVSVDVAMSAVTAMTGDDSYYLFICTDAVEFLQRWHFTGLEFVYSDPPYLMETRSSQRPIYDYEYPRADHVRLLHMLNMLPCSVALSGYHSALYEKSLTEWTAITFNAVTRGGSVATEYLWMNYPEPDALHDYQYLGDDYRERERIKRKKQRWVNRLQNLDKLERRAILWALREAGFAVDARQIRR